MGYFILGALLLGGGDVSNMSVSGGSKFIKLYRTVKCEKEVLINVNTILKVRKYSNINVFKDDVIATSFITYDRSYYLCTPYETFIKGMVHFNK